VVQANASTNKFVFTSSIAAEAWHPQKDPKAYEWWYFDALSDDGNEAIVVVFLDNFIYSPRHDRAVIAANDGIYPGQINRLPAVSFTYFSGGKPVYQAKSEFTADEFSAGDSGPKCRIGENGFRFDSASYGSGYLLSVDLPIARGRRLRANLEWLSIESDLVDVPDTFDTAAHSWNMVAPRCDVSGKITIEDPRGRTRKTHSFRGTGYHDHNLDNCWLAKTVKEWHWGRAHFADLTAVFCSFSEIGAERPHSQFLLTRDGQLSRHDDAAFEEHGHAREVHGIRYPKHLTIVANDGIRFEVRPLKVIDSTFYHLRFLSSIVLQAGGREHLANGITEFIAPRVLRYRWLTWLSELRTGRN
jgi:carotenoid 1,2-hydratase